MKYKGFYVKITPDTDLHREDKDGNDIRCEGFTIEVLRMNPKNSKSMFFQWQLILNC